MGKMLRQVQKLQEDMGKLQEELKERTVEATSGGGMVRAVVTGSQELKSLEISREAIEAEDVELLQDMVVAAVNEALRKAQEMVSQEMKKLTGGLNIPGLM